MVQTHTNYNKWQIIVKTDQYKGLSTIPVAEIITLPSNVVQKINCLVLEVINYALTYNPNSKFNYTNDGIQAVELLSNLLLAKAVHGAYVRTDLYPDESGVCVVVNVKYSDITTIEYNKDKIEVI